VRANACYTISLTSWFCNDGTQTLMHGEDSTGDVGGDHLIDSFRALHPRRRYGDIAECCCHNSRPPSDKCIDYLRSDAYTCWMMKTGARATNYGSRIDYIMCSSGLLTSGGLPLQQRQVKDAKTHTPKLLEADIMPEVESLVDARRCRFPQLLTCAPPVVRVVGARFGPLPDILFH